MSADTASCIVIGFAQLSPDAIGRLAVDHFTGRLFTRFAFFGHESKRYSDLRRDAFRAALAAKGLDCSVYPTPKTILARFNLEVMRLERYLPKGESQTIRAWLAKLVKPIAVFCSNDLRAYQLISVCRTVGIRVPEDVSVLGVDDDDLICNFTSPPISSIDPNAADIGFAAAKELDALLGGARRRKHLTVPPAGLVERLSSRAYAVEPAWLSDALVYIRQNLAAGISAADVCAHAKLSHTVVNTAFKRAFGTTVQKTVAEMRLQEAMRLLEEGMPPSKVAAQSGFHSLSYLANSFTARFGKSPSHYLKPPAIGSASHGRTAASHPHRI